MITVRPYLPEDRAAVLALAPRLAEGVATWRDPGAVGTAVLGWVTGSLERTGNDDHEVFVAVRDGHVTGFVTVTTRTHFTGSRDAYVGELVVSPEAERTGVGSALMSAAESWARAHGLHRVTLETGAANLPARAFYRSLGFTEEDVRLSKPI
ncbi:GNAT family N-acetyltransferase [Streptosporangium sp. NPDC049376]|uniref:GNAT family N-acetyltransferase n=1 Tax=Streptosporangium sp. NPDC049376 TaxID=3366192 RepID=UPI0037B2A61A